MKLLARRFSFRSRLLLTTITIITVCDTIQAAEFKLMSSGGMKVALIDIIPVAEGPAAESTLLPVITFQLP